MIDYKDLTKQEIEFLKESNAIEKEYSEEALKDSIGSWNYAKVMIPIGRKIDIQYIKTIHKFLMKRLDSRIAGKIRDCDIQVGGRVCMPPSAIKFHLQELCSDRHPINTESEIKDWHILFEKIHPFEDGNGRVGRILMNIQRFKIDLPILIIHEGREQYNYYKWFK